MKIHDKHGTFDQAVSESPDKIGKIARHLRALIAEIYPDAVEVAWPIQGIIGYGVGPRKMTEHFCYIGLYKQHVNLGFYQGAHLADPAGLLEGTGVNLRHMKVRDIAALDQPGVRDLIEASLVERKIALGLG